MVPELTADPTGPLAALAGEQLGPLRSGSQQTAKRAVEILLAYDEGFHAPTRAERQALLVAFAQSGQVLYGAAFDVVRCSQSVDYSDVADIVRRMEYLTVYEVKSTNRANVGPSLAGYFFNLTTAELLVAQSLGERFKFVFVNILTATYLEMELREVFARAKGIYPSWSIKF